MDGFQTVPGNASENDRDQRRRIDCERAYDNMIEAAVAQGWLREEIGLEMADIAEDYILKLASRLK